MRFFRFIKNFSKAWDSLLNEDGMKMMINVGKSGFMGAYLGCEFFSFLFLFSAFTFLFSCTSPFSYTIMLLHSYINALLLSYSLIRKLTNHNLLKQWKVSPL